MTPARILIVEDDPLFLASMRALLSGAGYEVTASLSSTDSNLHRMMSEADLVMLDLKLPDRSGFEVLREIRESADTTGKPVLMLTAHDPMTYRLKGLSLGADDYVVKPPHRDELLLRIAGLLRRSGGSDELVPAPNGRIRVDNPGGGFSFVRTADVSHIIAARNYCHVYTAAGRRLTSASIGQLEDELEGQFVRTHRSYLVNLACVRAARWESNSSYVLDLDTAEPTAVPVGRAYRNDVRTALGIAERVTEPVQ